MLQNEKWDARRWQSLGLSVPVRRYDVEYVDLTYDQLMGALNGRFLDPEEHQNDATPAHELLDFAARYPDLDMTFECYIVCADRPDRRISIAGVVVKNASPGCIQWLKDRRPDEFDTLNGLTRAWWD